MKHHLIILSIFCCLTSLSFSQIANDSLMQGLHLEVTVVDEDTKEGIPNSEITLYNLNTEIEYTTFTNEFGKVILDINNDSEYNLRTRMDDLADPDFFYMAISKQFNTYGVIEPALLNTTVELKIARITSCPGILDPTFDYDSYLINKETAQILDYIVDILKDYPTYGINLEGSSSCTSNHNYNIWISAKREQAVLQYVLNKGVDADRVIASSIAVLKGNKIIEKDKNCYCESIEDTKTEYGYYENKKTILVTFVDL